MFNIASNIISKFPSPQILAELCGVDVSTVHKWKYSKEKGGQEGLVPAPYQQIIIDYSLKNGIGITPEDFFPQYSSPQGGDSKTTSAVSNGAAGRSQQKLTKKKK